MKKEELHAADNISVFIITDLFVMSLVVLLTNYMTIQKWDKKQLRNANMLDNRIYQPSYRGKKQYAFTTGAVTRK